MNLHIVINELIVQRATELTLHKAHAGDVDCMDLDKTVKQAQFDIAQVLRACADVLDPRKEASDALPNA